jgi:hypothetical protein
MHGLKANCTIIVDQWLWVNSRATTTAIPASGAEIRRTVRRTTALTLEADLAGSRRDVSEVPEAVVSTRSKKRLFDYVGGGHLHDRRHREAERLRRFEIDDEFDLRGLLHRKLGGLLTLEDAIDIESSLVELGI